MKMTQAAVTVRNPIKKGMKVKAKRRRAKSVILKMLKKKWKKILRWSNIRSTRKCLLTM